MRSARRRTSLLRPTTSLLHVDEESLEPRLLAGLPTLPKLAKQARCFGSRVLCELLNDESTYVVVREPFALSHLRLRR